MLTAESFTMKNTHFDEQHILHELKHFLPSQTPLKDFIHHNSLHAFQHLKFYDGIFQASKIFGYQVTLQLGEYRKLYDLGRIKKNILVFKEYPRLGITMSSIEQYLQ